MLLKAKERLPQGLFVVCKADNPPLPPKPLADIITFNSVLHHFRDPYTTLKKYWQVLKPGGLFIISHEPNSRFFRNILIRSTYLLLSGIYKLKKRVAGKKADKDTQWEALKLKLLSELKSKGYDFKDFAQVQRFVDYHSPTAGGNIDPSRGIDPFLIMRSLHGSRLIEYRSYDHLGRIGANSRRSLVRALTKVFERAFPKDGSLFYLILERL